MGKEGRPADILSLARALQRADPDLESATANIQRSLGEEAAKSKEEVIREITYGIEIDDKDGVRRIRVSLDNNYIYVDLGIRPKDKPDEFSVRHSLTLNKENLPLVKEVLDSIEE